MSQQYPPLPPQPAPRPQVRHGLGIAALISGGVGLLFGLVTLTFWVAGPLAVAAIVCGLAGVAKHRSKLAVGGAGLGAAAAALSIFGASCSAR